MQSQNVRIWAGVGNLLLGAKRVFALPRMAEWVLKSSARITAAAPRTTLDWMSYLSLALLGFECFRSFRLRMEP